MTRRPPMLLALLLGVGCTSAPGAPDAGGVDAGIDAGRDAGAEDAGPDDAGPLDAGFVPDAGPIDAGRRPCADTYGSAASFTLCAERATECEFYTRLDSVRTCDTVCEAAGGTCLGGWNEAPDPGMECVRAAAEPCDNPLPDMICVCERLL